MKRAHASTIRTEYDRGHAPETGSVLDYIGIALEMELPLDVENVARRAIADYVAVTVAGVDSPPARHTISFACSRSGDPLATILGVGVRVPVELAALANGTAAHALDFDDDEPRVFVGHTSAPVLSAAFPAAEVCHSSVHDLLRAFVAGVEVEFRVGKAVNPAHYMDGWHATSTLGVFGATVACAVLSRLNRRQTACALGLAASFASGLKRNFGTMTKPLHVGLAAEAALRATTMAQGGFTADEAIFDGRLSVLHVFGGSEVPAQHVFRDLGDRFMLIDPGVNIKRYPSCSSTHPAIDVLLEITREFPTIPGAVEAVDCYVAPGTEDTLQYGIPMTPLEARFSMPFCLSAALVTGGLGLEAFSHESLRDPDILDLAGRTMMHADPAMQRPDAAVSTAARVVVRFRDGRRCEGTAWEPKGSPSLPLTTGELSDKYLACVAPVLGLTPAQRSFECILGTASSASTMRLVELLQPSEDRASAPPVVRTED